MHTTQLNCFLTAPQSLQKERKWINRYPSCSPDSAIYRAQHIRQPQSTPATLLMKCHARRQSRLIAQCSAPQWGGISARRGHETSTRGPQALTLATFTRESILIKLQMRVINTRFTPGLKWVVITRAFVCDIFFFFQLNKMSVNGSAGPHHDIKASADSSALQRWSNNRSHKKKKPLMIPGIRWARRCWRPAPPGATVWSESPTRSTPGRPEVRRWPGRTPAAPPGCGRHGCTGSSWTGRSACHSRSGSAAAAERGGPRRAGRSSPTCMILERRRRRRGHASVIHGLVRRRRSICSQTKNSTQPDYENIVVSLFAIKYLLFWVQSIVICLVLNYCVRSQPAVTCIRYEMEARVVTVKGAIPKVNKQLKTPAVANCFK